MENETIFKYLALLRSISMASQGLWTVTEEKGESRGLFQKLRGDLPEFAEIDLLPVLSSKSYSLIHTIHDIEGRIAHPTISYLENLPLEKYSSFLGEGICNYWDNPGIIQKHVLVFPLPLSSYVYDHVPTGHGRNITNFFDRTHTHGIRYLDLSELPKETPYIWKSFK